MRSRHPQGPLATVALGLSLWMALPSLEWCPFRWDDCTASCTDADVVACGTPVAACEAGAGGPCEAANAASCASGAACAAPADDRAGGCDVTPDPIPFGDRAYCVHPPVDGLLVHPLQLDPPGAAALLAMLAPPLELHPPVTATPRTPVPAFLPPPLAAPHAPPLARAPPVA